jgi:Arc/MetJ-type ribon-helix-helix transcriptional regulator
MPRRTIRLPEAVDERIDQAAKLWGYSSPSAFLRAAIKKELSERTEGTVPSSAQMVGSLKDIQNSIRRLERAQQALFALVDSLTKAFLTCVPEPRGAALELALAEARNRHARLLASAGHAMLSDSSIALEGLMKHGEKGVSHDKEW